MKYQKYASYRRQFGECKCPIKEAKSGYRNLCLTYEATNSTRMNSFRKTIQGASKELDCFAGQRRRRSSQALLAMTLMVRDITPHSRDSIRPSFAKFVRPKNERAQGRPGARCTRGLMCKMHIAKRTRAYRFSGSSPAFPAQWFYGLFRALPGETWLACHRHPQEACASQELDTNHWGVRTTRLRRPPHASLVKGASASTAPRPNVSDDGQRPLSRDGMAEISR